jgi:mRNA interferase RelE/StbE
MADYSITLTRTAQKQLDLLPEKEFAKIIDSLRLLAINPRPSGCTKLKGRDGYRIRCGNYRIIYDIYDGILVVEVIAIGHRKDIYR